LAATTSTYSIEGGPENSCAPAARGRRRLHPTRPPPRLPADQRGDQLFPAISRCRGPPARPARLALRRL